MFYSGRMAALWNYEIRKVDFGAFCMKDLCTTPTPCPLLLKSGKCGHQVLYGPDACWRRDGRPERCAGLSGEGGKSPFENTESSEVEND